MIFYLKYGKMTPVGTMTLAFDQNLQGQVKGRAIKPTGVN